MKAGSTMFARAASQVVRRYCGCCGEELSAHQALSSGICDKPRCRDWKIARVGAELLERRRREVMERLFDQQAPVVARAAAAIDATPVTIVRGTIPWQGSPVAPLAPERRADFAEHLRWIVAEAFARPVPRDGLAERQAAEADETPLTATACAACRGQCCSRGGTTGFLQPADIGRWRQRAPETPPDEIVDWYLGVLPQETIAGACVFQAASGCALPRERRSDHCNTFYCRSLQTLHERLEEAGGPVDGARVVMIVDDEAADEARGVVGWSAATGPIGFVAIRPEPAETPQDGREPACDG
jgi:hypothetical protein